MLKPKYIERLPERMLELYSQVEMDILADMAARISAQDYFIPAAQWQYQKLIEMGNFHSFIVEALASITGKTRTEIESLMVEAGMKSLSFDTGIYRQAGLNPPPLAASAGFQAILQTGIDSTEGLFINLTHTTARTATRQLEHALDRAWLQISTGAFDYNTAIRSAVKDLAAKGVEAIAYPTGHTDTLEVAVRRAVVTGVNQTALRLQDKLAYELGSDLVETTAHSGARPSHAKWQGKVFSRSGTHPKYPKLSAPQEEGGTGYGTGPGLGGWNCRHSFFPFFEGQERTYTQSMLDEMNSTKYEYNGEKMTEYEAAQKQRYIERNIRRWKREFKAMEAAGQPTDESAAKLAKWQSTQKDFLEQTDLKRQHDRENISGFGREEAARAAGQAKKAQHLAYETQKAYTIKQEEVRQHILSPDTPKALNIGNQNKHIRESKGYIAGRSYIYGDLETAQRFVNQYHGTGEPRFTRSGVWTNKEYIETDTILGVVVDMDTLIETQTTAVLIHYGKKGTHIVPTKEAIKK